MFSDERKNEIYEQAKKVNDVAEGYQLIHACYAVQKVINEHINRMYQGKFKEIREKLMDENIDNDTLEALLKKRQELDRESQKSRINISIQYIDSLKGLNATTTRIGTYKNTFIISLPEELKNIRDDDGEFDFDKMYSLRKLMAHELGHILLHTDCIDEDGVNDADGNMEEECEYFSKIILDMRRERNRKFYRNNNFEKF